MTKSKYLAIIVLSIAAAVPSLADATRPAISSDCVIDEDEPARSSSLSVYRRDTGATYSSLSSYILVKGTSPNVIDADPPTLGMQISALPGALSTPTRWGDTWFSESRIKLYLPELKAELPRDSVTVEISLAGKLFHTIPNQNVSLFNSADYYSGVYWYDVVARVDESEGRKFVSALENLSSKTPMVFSVKSGNAVVGISHFQQQDVIALQKAAVSDWKFLEKALASGECIKSVSN